MLLIDAINVKSRGGIVLLDYLARELDRRKVNYRIVDEEMAQDAGSFPLLSKIPFYKYIQRSRSVRKYAKEYGAKKLLCFGNFPPAVPIPGTEVITYFQNALLLRSVNLKEYNIQRVTSLRMKQFFLRSFLKNTNVYVFQTENLKNSFRQENRLPSELVVYPFFDLTKVYEIQAGISGEREAESFIYPGSAQPHKNHDNLFAAWELMAEQSLYPTLKVTVTKHEENTTALAQIKRLREKGVKIVNLGSLPYDQMLKQIAACKFVVYPSLIETIGLSLVEGALLHCKVLVSDYPYHKDVISPSDTFDPLNPGDIARSVRTALTTELPDTKVIIENQIDPLISYLTE